MGQLRAILNKLFSEKQYPDPNNPAVAKAIKEGREWFEREYLWKEYRWILGSRSSTCAGILTEKIYETRYPGDSWKTVVGRFHQISGRNRKFLDQLLGEVLFAGRNFAETVPWKMRIKLLLEISKVVEERYWLLVAAKQYETGQSIMEAIGETDEEVDFPLARAMHLEELNEDLLLETNKSAGDRNGFKYVPHGTFLNISPFNFPGAIPMDMACMALAMGNAFIEKSSDKSSLCGYLVYENIKIAFERLGIPHVGVINYVPGDKEVVDILLESPKITGVSFTGSSEVLLEIKKKHHYSMGREGYCGRAPLIFGAEETSGVNIVVVWNDTDLEYAAKECVKSFVGRSGQKCSSARIIMVHESVAIPFGNLLRVELLRVRYGNVLRDNADLGPVINKSADETIKTTIRWLFESGVTNSIFEKKLIPLEYSDHVRPSILEAIPHIWDDVEKALLLMNTEIFGPVATVLSVPDVGVVEQLCTLSEFALTGGYFTEDLDTAMALSKIIPAGNSYSRRKIVGAFPETEPFGGLRSRSSAAGRKRKATLLNFASMKTHSGFYGQTWDQATREEYIRQMENDGVVFSKK